MTGYKLGNRKNNINRNAFILGEIFKANDINYSRTFNSFYFIVIKNKHYFINLHDMKYIGSGNTYKSGLLNLMKKYIKEKR